MEDNIVNIVACEDVVVEILCRLPGKDLIRCKCICRAWHCLICEVCIPRVSHNPPFSCLSVSFNGPFMGPGKKTKAWRFKHLDIEEQESGGPPRSISETGEGTIPCRHPTDYLLDSCNGLLLFHSPMDHLYYVCNPTTKEVVMLPEGCSHVELRYTVLAFDPRKSPQYKVVHFAPSGGTHVVMDIYSSESGRWSSQTLPLDNLVPFCNWYKHAVFFEGTIYRLSGESHLVCFDLNAVVSARRIGIPGTERKIFSDPGVLGSLMGYLCFSDPGVLGSLMGYLCYAKLFPKELNVWFLNDQCKGGQWILKYRVTSDLEKEVPQCVKHPFFGLAFLGPFGFHPSSDVIFIGTPEMILSYDVKSNTLTEVFRISKYTTFIYPVFPHVQCLVALANTGSKSL